MATDMMSWVVLGVVVIGGIWLYKNWGNIAMGFMQPGGGGGGAGGYTGDGTYGGTGTGMGMGMGVDCSVTPDDPTCQLQTSADYLGPGATSKSQIAADVRDRYRGVCVGSYGCKDGFTKSFMRRLPQIFPTNFDAAGGFRRGSPQYSAYVQGIVQKLATDNCPACLQGLGQLQPGVGVGAMPFDAAMPYGQACVSEASTASYPHKGETVKVCDNQCAKGYKTCILGLCNGRPLSLCYCNDVSWGQLHTAIQNYVSMYGCTPGQGRGGMMMGGGGGGGGGPMRINSNCTYYPSSRNYCWSSTCYTGDPGHLACAQGSCDNARSLFLTRCAQLGGGGGGSSHTGGSNPSGHCTKLTSGPYAGHCVGDPCGPGGAVMSNGLCSRSNPPRWMSLGTV